MTPLCHKPDLNNPGSLISTPNHVSVLSASKLFKNHVELKTCHFLCYGSIISSEDTWSPTAVLQARCSPKLCPDEEADWGDPSAECITTVARWKTAATHCQHSKATKLHPTSGNTATKYGKDNEEKAIQLMEGQGHAVERKGLVVCPDHP